LLLGELVEAPPFDKLREHFFTIKRGNSYPPNQIKTTKIHISPRQFFAFCFFGFVFLFVASTNKKRNEETQTKYKSIIKFRGKYIKGLRSKKPLKR